MVNDRCGGRDRASCRHADGLRTGTTGFSKLIGGVPQPASIRHIGAPAMQLEWWRAEMPAAWLLHDARHWRAGRPPRARAC
ncbi:hypothetical protein QT786_20205, partial [Xanthomonas citri pv. citri]